MSTHTEICFSVGLTTVSVVTGTGDAGRSVQIPANKETQFEGKSAISTLRAMLARSSSIQHVDRQCLSFLLLHAQRRLSDEMPDDESGIQLTIFQAE